MAGDEREGVKALSKGEEWQVERAVALIENKCPACGRDMVANVPFDSPMTVSCQNELCAMYDHGFYPEEIKEGAKKALDILRR